MDKVRKEGDGLRSERKTIEILDLTPELLQQISYFNGNLSAEQVEVALRAGRAIYTSFSRYTLVQ